MNGHDKFSDRGTNRDIEGLHSSSDAFQKALDLEHVGVWPILDSSAVSEIPDTREADSHADSVSSDEASGMSEEKRLRLLETAKEYLRDNPTGPYAGIMREEVAWLSAQGLASEADSEPRTVDMIDAPIEETGLDPDPVSIREAILERGDTWPDKADQISEVTSRIEYNEAEDIFKRVQIRGDGRAGELTSEILENAGLLPHHRLEIEGRAMWFSHGYDIGGGRIAVMGYVQDDDGSVVARSYYRSNSQGIWRYLPQYQMREGRVSWYSKGYGEESVTLPALLQESLTNSIEDDGGVLELDSDVARAAFTGTARHVGSTGTVYHNKVSPESERLRGIPAHGGILLPSPDKVRTEPEQSPKFDTVLAAWQQDTSLYGRVAFEVVPSNDGTLRFLFCRDEKGRAWVSSVENNSPVESTGLRQQWLSGGVLTTPAYEYSQQSAGYGNEQDRRGNYVDMFENYLSKIPVIQEYIASKESHS